MKTIKAILTFVLTVTCLALQGQELDSVQRDLENLSDIDFFKKYSFYDKTVSRNDITVTKLIWSLEQFRDIDKELRQKGVPTFTKIDGRPSKKNRYYIIGHYQLPTPDHLARMSYYRVHSSGKTIDYQNLDDFMENKWRRLH